jgi:hypothetical protein
LPSTGLHAKIFLKNVKSYDYKKHKDDAPGILSLEIGKRVATSILNCSSKNSRQFKIELQLALLHFHAGISSVPEDGPSSQP